MAKKIRLEELRKNFKVTTQKAKMKDQKQTESEYNTESALMQQSKQEKSQYSDVFYNDQSITQA